MHVINIKKEGSLLLGELFNILRKNIKNESGGELIKIMIYIASIIYLIKYILQINQ